jgi:hypothetical protein
VSLRVDNILPPGWLDVFSSQHPRIGIGLDPATTTKQTSNPSSLTIVQQVNLLYIERLVLRLKTDDPDVWEWLLRAIVGGLRSRGLSARRLCIAATNERFFAVTMRKRLAGKVPVELVIESEKTSYLGEEMLYKAYLGNLVVNTIEDGYLPLPPCDWLKKDYRSVVRDRGTFDAELLEDGGHGDCFVSAGLALHALRMKGGKVEAQAAGASTLSPAKATRKLVNRDFRRGGRGRVAC